ncbi:MAG: HAD family hydrolase [Anaerolineales bacterium]|nr:HAD family hydrolase [Anaerolineales bacterium]
MSLDPTRVQALLFDLDGTLADTDDEYIRRVGRRLRALSFLFPRRDPAPFLRWGLLAAETPLNALMGLPDWLGVDGPLARVADWLANRRGASTAAAHFVLMAGVAEMLPRLGERYPLAVVTARGARAAQGFLTQFGLAERFAAVASAQTAPHTKPYPDPVLWAARRLGVPVEACLMIGDTTVDILAGKRAGAQTIGVLCGFGARAELERAGANLILDTTAELAGALGQTPPT